MVGYAVYAGIGLLAAGALLTIVYLILGDKERLEKSMITFILGIGVVFSVWIVENKDVVEFLKEHIGWTVIVIIMLLLALLKSKIK